MLQISYASNDFRLGVNVLTLIFLRSLLSSSTILNMLKTSTEIPCSLRLLIHAYSVLETIFFTWENIPSPF